MGAWTVSRVATGGPAAPTRDCPRTGSRWSARLQTSTLQRLVPASEPVPHGRLAGQRALGRSRELFVFVGGRRASERTCCGAERVDAVTVPEESLAGDRGRRIGGESGGFHGFSP